MFPSEAYVLKSSLESEGINCYLKNELIVQTDPFNSNAVGGVQLQVQTSQIEEALLILKERNIQPECEEKLNPLYFKLVKWVSYFPLINKLPELLGVFTLFFLFVLIIISLIYLRMVIVYG
jgi:hypothetical protein